MAEKYQTPRTIHATLTPAEADSVARLARSTGRSQRQIVRDALALLTSQQPTAITAAQTIDAAMERIADRLQSALAGALTAHAKTQRTESQADLQAAINTMLRNLLPGAEIAAPPPANPRSLLAQIAARQGLG
ncbi:hypothetical protein [Metallibacterium sp.]|uniref:hypothetical protein n=1 Tax=Metallibacterium sp. TaxID=2940281 RepID=UPI00261021BC|nr:hypothetical protein [Metallibacterium sp.]